MLRVLIQAVGLSVLGGIGGYVEHESIGGAALVLWLVPIVIQGIRIGEHRDEVEKKYAKKMRRLEKEVQEFYEARKATYKESKNCHQQIGAYA